MTSRPRIIPCLLIHNGGLVKTKMFKDPKYVGDPINTIRIFNEKKTDELIVLDIDASIKSVEPNYKLISQIAAECRMPLCYGGGIVSAEQAERIINLGVEKVSISAAAIKNPDLVTSIADRIGQQSIIATLDVKKERKLFQSYYSVYSHNGKKRHDLEPVPLAKKLQDAGAGEILVNSIDRDGQMCGYDLEIAALLNNKLRVPITVLGGAGKLEHMQQLVSQIGLVGAAAGSLFVFKGRYRAVLVNYPTSIEKTKISLDFNKDESH